MGGWLDIDLEALIDGWMDSHDFIKKFTMISNQLYDHANQCESYT